MKGHFRQDLLNFIGHRIVTAMREIKPKLLDEVCSKEEEAYAEQEAIYLRGLSDGLALATIFPLEKRGETSCKEV